MAIEGQRISESVGEVDQLLDDMAGVSSQMREGKQLYSPEEVKSLAREGVEEIVAEVNDVSSDDLDNWINGRDNASESGQADQDPNAENNSGEESDPEGSDSQNNGSDVGHQEDQFDDD